MLHRLSRIPLRVASGAYIANSGLQKISADEEHAKQLHAFASNAYPQFAEMDAKTFIRMLGYGELAVGSALLLPLVKNRAAGLILTGFASGLMWLYWRTPGTHPPGDPRPTADGTPLAKDVWLVGIGLALTLDR
jgi:hypothetical protein